MSKEPVDSHPGYLFPGQGSNEGDQVSASVSVVIVGAGPTGLSIGNFLGIAGIATLIVERNTGLSSYPRAIALDDD